MNCCAAGATVIGCSRSKLDALPGTEAEPDWARRSAQMTCDQGDYRAIDAFVSRGRREVRSHRHPGQQRRRHGAHPACRGRPGARPKDPGRTAKRRRLRAHRAVPLVRDPDEPDQPALVRHPGVPADARRRTAPGRSSTSPAAQATPRLTHAGLLRRRQIRPEPYDAVAGGGMGPPGARQLSSPRPDHDRQLPQLRTVEGRPRRCGVLPQRSAQACG